MGITFLKSILAGRRHKHKNSPDDKPVEMETRSFHDDQASEKAFDAVDRGVCNVSLEQIIGSVGRYHDFDGRFRIKSHVPPERLQKIKQALRQGKPLPPVKLYQIKDEYYVLDGNHRVAAAKEFGHDSIRAQILEFTPSSNTLENILYREKSEFKEATGLTEPIDLTEIGQYEYLKQQIKTHQAHMQGAIGKRIPYSRAAEDWLNTIYTPLAGIVRKSGLLSHFPDRTVADLYAYVSFHQWEIGRRRTYGIGLDKLIPKNMEAFRDKMAGSSLSRDTHEINWNNKGGGNSENSMFSPEQIVKLKTAFGLEFGKNGKSDKDKETGEDEIEDIEKIVKKYRELRK